MAHIPEPTPTLSLVKAASIETRSIEETGQMDRWLADFVKHLHDIDGKK